MDSDELKLPTLLGMTSQRQRFAGLAMSQAMTIQELSHDSDTHTKASPQQFFGNLGPRQIGPQNAVLVGVASRPGIDDLQKGSVDSRKKRQTALPATPFFRARRGGKRGSG